MSLGRALRLLPTPTQEHNAFHCSVARDRNTCGAHGFGEYGTTGINNRSSALFKRCLQLSGTGMALQFQVRCGAGRMLRAHRHLSIPSSYPPAGLARCLTRQTDRPASTVTFLANRSSLCCARSHWCCTNADLCLAAGGEHFAFARMSPPRFQSRCIRGHLSSRSSDFIHITERSKSLIDSCCRSIVPSKFRFGNFITVLLMSSSCS